MRDFELCVGHGANHLELLPLGEGRATASSEDLLYEAENQIGYNALESNKPWRAEERDVDNLEVNPYFRTDKSQIVNGGAESVDALTWPPMAITLGAWYGDVSRAASPHSGTLAWQFGTEGFMSQWIEGVAGQTMTLEAWMDAVGGNGICYIYIEELGLNWNGSAWVETAATALTSTGSGYSLKTTTFTLPAYDETVPSGVYHLKISFEGDGTRVDDIACWHHTSLGAVIGHDVHPLISGWLMLASDEPTFAAPTEIEFEERTWPNIWTQFPLRGERYWGLQWLGVVDEQPWIGQWWLSQPEVYRAPDMGVNEIYVRQVSENFASGGARKFVPKESIRRSNLVFSWTQENEGQFRELRDMLFERSGYGEFPMLVIRNTEDPRSAHMVFVPKEFTTRFLETDVDARQVSEMTFPGTAYPTF